MSSNPQTSTTKTMKAETQAVRASDLFVLLDRAFRQKTRNCHTCTFSLPFKTRDAKAAGSNWTIMASEGCEPGCRAVLEDLLAKFQANYRLADA